MTVANLEHPLSFELTRAFVNFKRVSMFFLSKQPVADIRCRVFRDILKMSGNDECCPVAMSVNFVFRREFHPRRCSFVFS